ncbi:MAG: hypothetical protein AAF298_23165 [Cyanobacteria bacterium P01_A01_bin.40]
MGNDYIYILSGDHQDLIYGNEGDDELLGDSNNDTIYGGDGIDRL